MSKFPDVLCLKDGGMRGDSRLFILEKDFRYYSSKGLITVPAGFVTDGASIPELFWNIIGPFGPYFPASIIHDYLYSSLNESFTRQECDEIFLEGMEDLQVSWVKRKIIYRAVRLFGWACYKGYKE